MADELKNNHAAEHENAYNPTKDVLMYYQYLDIECVELTNTYLSYNCINKYRRYIPNYVLLPETFP